MEENIKVLKRKEKGITLIALVITIIVLLILAGVSIAMLTGQNGILTQAQNASKQTDIGKEKEQIAVAYNGVKTKKEGEDVTSGELDAELKANGADATATGTDPITVTFNDSKRSYTIDANGNITGPESEESGETGETEQGDIVAIMKIEGTKVETPPIPTGFSHIDGTVDDGYVIQDGDGNQFVWVPVDKDQKLQINVTSKEDIESITVKDPYGDTILTVNNEDVGTSYTNENVEPTINGVYELTVVAGEETKNVELNVSSLYAQRMWELEQWTDEVAKLYGFESLDDMLQDFFDGIVSVEDAKTMIKAMTISDYKGGKYKDTEDKSISVNNNGGFYIGRYEASEDNGNVAVKKGLTPLHDITQIEALDKAKNMYNNLSSKNFESSLLTGAAWDRTLCWLEGTKAVTSFEIVGDSKTWGNYSDDDFSNSGLINTGEFSETEKNHIYDLAGNLAEWTTEAMDTNYRVNRGRII